jgi:hypothetical protein
MVKVVDSPREMLAGSGLRLIFPFVAKAGEPHSAIADATAIDAKEMEGKRRIYSD